MANLVGQQLGKYRLTQLLGQGGFAEVYLGEHVHLDTLSAIKILYNHLAHEEIQDFLSEARTIANLEHPHIVRVLDFEVHEGIAFLVMTYAPNGTLRQQHPKGSRLPLPTIVNYVQQVTDALQYAHDQKLIHRDIKPENMLLGRQNEVLLSDFGIALVAQSSSVRSTQKVIGTAAYMAPEQLQGKARRASDQYSLGIVVYEWLCGERPFHGSFTEIYSQHLFTPPSSLCEKVPGLPSVIEKVVLTALAKDPQQRFPTVKAFGTALEQAYLTAQAYPVALPFEVTPPREPSLLSERVATILPGVLPPSMGRVTLPGRSLQGTNAVTPLPEVTPLATKESVRSGEPQLSEPRLSRRWIMIGLIGLAMGGGGLTWLEISQRSHVSSSPLRPITTHPLLPLGTLLYSRYSHGNLTDVAWSPNGMHIAAGVDWTVQVWDAVDNSHFFKYQGHSGAFFVYAVAWSSDSKRIASVSDDMTVELWDAVDGGHEFIYQGHTAAVLNVAWSPNGKRIASSDAAGIVQVWDAIDGSHVLTYHGHTSQVNAVAWSPNSTRIASGSDDSTVQIWDASDGRHIFTYRAPTTWVNTVAWSPDGTRIASASGDGTAQVWNVADGSHVFTYHGHSGIVNSIAWSPNGASIASASDDKTVQLWETTVGSHVFTYRGHSKRVSSAVWSPNGTRIASAGGDWTVQVWQAV